MTKITDFKLTNTEIYDTNSLNTSWTEKSFRKKGCGENQNPHSVSNIFSETLGPSDVITTNKGERGQRNYYLHISPYSGFGGLGVASWPLVPKIAGSNPAEAVGFLGRKKSSARLPSKGK